MTEALHAKVISGAKVVAYVDPDWRSGGPLLGDDPEDAKLAHQSGDKYFFARTAEEFSGSVSGRVGYAGCITFHFGHFVAESIHRIVPMQKFFGVDRYLFVAREGDPNTFDRIPQPLRNVLAYLNVTKDNTIVITQNTEVESLVVVQQGSTIGAVPHPAYLDLMRDFSNNRLNEMNYEKIPSQSVYVCGRRGPYGVILGASYIESFLKQAGFWIFRPEDHPYSFQLHVFRSAKTLLFSEGSAIHGASVLGRNMMNDVQVIIRRPETPYIVQRFRAELQGRCMRSELVFCCRYLGSLVRQNRIQVNHLGISMYNLSALKQIFYKNGIEKFARFNATEYFELCEKDLFDYNKYAMNVANNECTPADLSNLFARFELARRADSIDFN